MHLTDMTLNVGYLFKHIDITPLLILTSFRYVSGGCGDV